MYRIYTEDGATITYTESIRYILYDKNKGYCETDEENAEGIMAGGVMYSLPDKTLKGVETVAGVTEIDGAALIAEQESIIDDLLIAELEG